MAFQVTQPNSLPSGDYRDLLYGFEGTLVLSPDGTLQNAENPLASFSPTSTPGEVRKILEVLHKNETTFEKKSSQTIETLLQDRKARLLKMIGYIDVETSPRILTRDFICDLHDDFNHNIGTIIRSIPAPDMYLSKPRVINEKFIDAGAALDMVVDSLEIITENNNSSIQDILNARYTAYTALHTATILLEEGLSKWDRLPTPPKNGELVKLGLEEYLKVADEQFINQMDELNNIQDALINRKSDMRLEEQNLIKFECTLREEILKTLLAIPETPLPGGKKSEDQISDSKIFKYTTSKTKVIKSLREAKISLNLSLDCYTLKIQAGRLTRSDLNTYIIPCIKSLDEIFENLRES